MKLDGGMGDFRQDGNILRTTVMITNRRGLHARAAAHFVRLANGFDCEVTVTRNGQTVSGRSILGLMMLAAGPGTELEIAVVGREAREALEVLSSIVAAQFNET